MKRIIITESQYKRLLLSKKVIKEAMVSDIKGDIDIKGRELTNGGPVSSEWEKILNDLDDMLDAAGIKYKITAGNDKFHHRKNPGSRHAIGCAVDFVVRRKSGLGVKRRGFNKKYSKTVFEIMEKLVSKYGGSHDFSWLDEYNRGTGHSTGGHIHMSINRKWCGKADSGKEIKTKQTLSANAGEYTGDEQPVMNAKEVTIKDITTNNNDSEVIKSGSRGKGVEEIQGILDKKGYDLGPRGIDGIFGSYTKKAVEGYQKDNSLTVSGEVDLDTSKSMEKENV